MGLLSLWAVSVLIFAATNLLPGDPAAAILGKEATPERLAELRAELGTDRPAPERYVDWLSGVATLDFGRSVTQGVGAFAEAGAGGTPVTELIGTSIKNTAILAAVALVLLVALSILLGTVAAIRQGRPLDSSIQVVGLVFIAVPEFVLGAVLVILFSFVWPVLPAVSVDVTARTLVLPVATLVLCMLGVTVRLVRVGVIEVLQTNYVASARLRGIREATVLRRHVLPNSLGPTMQVFAIATGLFVGGVVVVEYLFGYPGIGTGFVNAVAGRDYPVVQAYTLVLAAAYIVANIIADVVTVLSNPRLRVAVAR
jgi:peptide/nickel transport system permease protein